MHKTIFSISIILLSLIFFSTNAFSELPYIDPATNQSVLDQVVERFNVSARTWVGVIQGAAESLFWTLVLISMVWTFGMMILRKADIGDFFAEFTRFIIFTGFFFWLLTNAVTGFNIAGTIISSMQLLGNQASGLTGSAHGNVMEVGYLIWQQAIDNLSIWDPIDGIIAIIISLIILIILAVIAVNMLLLLISAWVLMYAGIFFLGFGGSRWTSDIAINYFKTVLGVGIQLLVMTLIVGIGNDLLTNFYAQMGKNLLNFEELGVMLIFAVSFYVLISKLPPLLSGIITGSTIGSVGGIGSYNSGQIVGAGVTATAAVGMGASVTASGLSSGIDRLKAATTKPISPEIDIARRSRPVDIPKPFSGSNTNSSSNNISPSKNR